MYMNLNFSKEIIVKDSDKKKKAATKKVAKKKVTKKKPDKKKPKKSFKAWLNGRKLKDLIAKGEIKNVSDLSKCGKKAVIQYLRTKEKELAELLNVKNAKEAINGIYWMPKESVYPFVMYFIRALSNVNLFS